MLQFQTYGRPFVRREKLSLFMLQLGVNRKGWRNENRIDLVQLLIKCRPSRTYKDIKLNIEAHSTATASISRPCCPRPLTRREIDLEKMMRPAGRYVQKCRLTSITKCSLSQKVIKTHIILSNMK